MNIPIQALQPEGEFWVPGTRKTVNSQLVRRAVGLLPMRDRNAAVDYMTAGRALSEEVSESIRRAILQVAEERRERAFPSDGKNRSHSTAF